MKYLALVLAFIAGWYACLAVSGDVPGLDWWHVRQADELDEPWFA